MTLSKIAPKKENYIELNFLSFAFIVSASLAISFIVDSVLNFLGMDNRNVSWGVFLLSLAGIYVFCGRVFVKLPRKHQYLSLALNFFLIGVGILLFLESIKK